MGGGRPAPPPNGSRGGAVGVWVANPNPNWHGLIKGRAGWGEGP